MVGSLPPHPCSILARCPAALDGPQNGPEWTRRCRMGNPDTCTGKPYRHNLVRMESRARLFFGSDTFPRILGFLAEEPGREFSASEIAEHVSGSRDSLYRALDRARRLGLVTRAHRGGVSTYQINTKSPVYPEVKNLLSKLLGIAGALRSSLGQFDPPAIEQAFIYGSAARADDLYTSDIDLFVVGEIGLSASLPDHKM
jgi:DNA-binding transcriptional ArsR family regulator